LRTNGVLFFFGETQARRDAQAPIRFAERETVQRWLDAGFDAHLAKPMDAADLARLIVQVVGRMPA
jgi:CheY-like chemotaxis protein